LDGVGKQGLAGGSGSFAVAALVVAINKNSAHADFDVNVLLAGGIPEVNPGAKAAFVLAVEIALNVS
jgi:hypothetical protein